MTILNIAHMARKYLQRIKDEIQEDDRVVACSEIEPFYRTFNSNKARELLSFLKEHLPLLDERIRCVAPLTTTIKYGTLDEHVIYVRLDNGGLPEWRVFFKGCKSLEVLFKLTYV